jgi:hypothetical protein
LLPVSTLRDQKIDPAPILKDAINANLAVFSNRDAAKIKKIAELPSVIREETLKQLKGNSLSEFEIALPELVVDMRSTEPISDNIKTKIVNTVVERQAEQTRQIDTGRQHDHFI